MSDEMPYNLIKLILVGDTGTGKTNLISVATGNEFNSGIFTTTSCSYIQKIIKINQKEYKVNLWDTICQEKYRSLTKIFIKDSNIVIFTYDITKRDTFTSLPYWKNVIEEILGNDITFGVVGNKIDLYLEEKVKEQEGKKYADSIGALFKLTSAKNNPKEFSDFIEILLDKYLKEHKLHPRRDTIGIKKVNEKEKKGCC